MNPEAVNTLLQVGLFAIETYAAHKDGEISDDEVAERWTQIRARLEDANVRWENAVKKS